MTGASAPGLEEVARAKQAVRERVWALLERERAARFPGATGRIPNFAGVPTAAARLASLPAWRVAGMVKANPDAPQLPVRARALADGKLLYMAVPRLADERSLGPAPPPRRTLHRADQPITSPDTTRAVSGRRPAGLSMWLQG